MLTQMSVSWPTLLNINSTDCARPGGGGVGVGSVLKEPGLLEVGHNWKIYSIMRLK